MNALIFPGQGSQVIGMGLEFYNKFDVVKKIFNQAGERLNLPLTKIILEGPEDKLKSTSITQPAILTVSYSIFKILKNEFNLNLDLFKFFAGHSLGEYSALVCSNGLDFNDAIYLLHERGNAMQDAVPVGQGAMLAVLGLEVEKIKKLIYECKINGVCDIANDNADGQVIVSGDSESIKKFQNLLKNNKVKSIPLKVSAPFHCSLMKPAAIKMTEKIKITNFNQPSTKIVSNVTANSEEDPKKIKSLLIEQIFSIVRWRESLIFMSNNGVKNFIEIGPGKALTGMVKRTLKNVNCFSINSINDIEEFNDKFKK